MLRIEVIHVGKLKSTWIKEGVAHYRKLLSRQARLSLKVAKEADNASLSADQVRIEEGERIARQLRKGAYKIFLDEKGKQLPSALLAELLDCRRRDGVEVQIVVGGAFGLGEQLKKVADLQLSLSKMTLPHELALLVLLEQVFRALSILQGTKYHK